MREIKFRGKRIDNKKWTYGYLFNIWDKSYILWGTTNGIPNMEEVDPETVGQDTGLKDKNEKEIYEGDIIDNFGDKKEVVFERGCFCFNVSDTNWHLFDGKDVEVKGNIYENPELLKGGSK